MLRVSPASNVLITIPISHYCEKARWGLEYARVPYKEERHLQGFHFRAVRKVADTDTAPVLVTPEQVLTDSTDILKWCDGLAPADRKLYPSEPGLREEVEKFEDWLDEVFGPAGRLWMYTYVLDMVPLILRCSKEHRVPRYQLWLMPIAFPMVKGMINRALDRTATSREKSFDKVEEVLEKVAERLADGRKYLIGGRFTVADLTFASLSAAVLVPEIYGVRLPDVSELPEAMRDQVQVWRRHPAGEFAQRMFREHRFQ